MSVSCCSAVSCEDSEQSQRSSGDEEYSKLAPTQVCFREVPGHSWGPARTSLGKAHPRALSPTSEAQGAAVTGYFLQLCRLQRKSIS